MCYVTWNRWWWIIVHLKVVHIPFYTYQSYYLMLLTFKVIGTHTHTHTRVMSWLHAQIHTHTRARARTQASTNTQTCDVMTAGSLLFMIYFYFLCGVWSSIVACLFASAVTQPTPLAHVWCYFARRCRLSLQTFRCTDVAESGDDDTNSDFWRCLLVIPAPLTLAFVRGLGNSNFSGEETCVMWPGIDDGEFNF